MEACKKEHDCLPPWLQRCLAGGDLWPHLHLLGSCVAQAPDWGVSPLLRSVTATTEAGERGFCGKMLMTHFLGVLPSSLPNPEHLWNWLLWPCFPKVPLRLLWLDSGGAWLNLSLWFETGDDRARYRKHSKLRHRLQRIIREVWNLSQSEKNPLINTVVVNPHLLRCHLTVTMSLLFTQNPPPFLLSPIYMEHISSSQLQFPEVGVGCRRQVWGWRELSATDSISLLWLMAHTSARNWWAWESTYFFSNQEGANPRKSSRAYEHQRIQESQASQIPVLWRRAQAA